jgi:hypothetical protein
MIPLRIVAMAQPPALLDSMHSASASIALTGTAAAVAAACGFVCTNEMLGGVRSDFGGCSGAADGATDFNVGIVLSFFLWPCISGARVRGSE